MSNSDITKSPVRAATMSADHNTGKRILSTHEDHSLPLIVKNSQRSLQPHTHTHTHTHSKTNFPPLNIKRCRRLQRWKLGWHQSSPGFRLLKVTECALASLWRR